METEPIPENCRGCKIELVHRDAVVDKSLIIAIGARLGDVATTNGTITVSRRPRQDKKKAERDFTDFVHILQETYGAKVRITFPPIHLDLDDF